MMPKNAAGSADRADRLQLVGRLQPGRADRDQGARASTRRPRSPGPASVPITDVARSFDRTPADRRHQRAHAAAAADLDRARRERLDARRHGAADPPGRELPRGRALHRRAAQPARRRRRRCSSRAPPSASTATASRTQRSGGSSAAGRTWSGIFKRLRRAGIKRRDLYLAWDFTVASAQARSRRACSTIRDDAFRGLGDTNLGDLRVSGVGAQRSRSTKVTDFTPAPERARCQRPRGGHGRGALLPRPARLPGRLAVQPRAERPPIRTPGNVTDARLHLQHPARRVSSATPARPSLYGHGLFGSAGEVNSSASSRSRASTGFVLCATRLDRHVRASDVPNTVSILQDLSRFPELADRLQQGFLNFLFLGRAMIHPKRLRGEPGLPGRERRR